MSCKYPPPLAEGTAVNSPLVRLPSTSAVMSQVSVRVSSPKLVLSHEPFHGGAWCVSVVARPRLMKPVLLELKYRFSTCDQFPPFQSESFQETSIASLPLVRKSSTKPRSWMA